MSSKPTFGFVLEYVADVEAAKRFYVDVLGLGMERYHPTYVQFEHFAIAGDESMSGKREPEHYWLVEDADAAFNELSEKAEVVVPLKQMAFGKVFGIKPAPRWGDRAPGGAARCLKRCAVRKLIVFNLMSLDGYYEGPGRDVFALLIGPFVLSGGTPIFESLPAAPLRLVDARTWEGAGNVLVRYGAA